MRRQIEKVYCDCCGDEIVYGLSEYRFSPYQTKTLVLPEEIEKEYDNDGMHDVDTYTINDICDKCLKKLIDAVKPIIDQMKNE